MNAPKVSVCVWTYNQERYLRDCLDGIFSQEVNFDYEVVIGDDCSTDSTAKIISDYQQRYGDRMLVLNREKNLGAQRNSIDVLNRASGEFVAICEGDDYWTDSGKLQKQYDALLRFPEIDLCFHPAREYRNEVFDRIICDYSTHETILPLQEVIRGGGAYMPTASLLYRRRAILPLSTWFVDYAPVGDTFLQILGSVRGGALYLPQDMSVYRRFTAGSVTRVNAINRFSCEVLSKRADSYHAAFSGLRSALPDEYDRDIDYALAVEFFGVAIRALDNEHIVLFCHTCRRISWKIAIEDKAFLALKLASLIPYMRKPVLRLWKRSKAR